MGILLAILRLRSQKIFTERGSQNVGCCQKELTKVECFTVHNTILQMVTLVLTSQDEMVKDYGSPSFHRTFAILLLPHYLHFDWNGSQELI